VAGIVVGANHRVYFSRRNPHRSVLQPGAGVRNYIVITILIVVCVVVAIGAALRFFRIASF
jgi:hypothetical protein